MHNLSFTHLPYIKDVYKKYQNFKDLPGFVVLESKDQTQGRFDIISAYPYDELKILHKDASLSDAMQQFAARLPIEKSTSDCPFQGGAIGYVAYDLGACEYNLEYRPHPNLQHMPLMHMRWYDWAIIVDHHKCSAYIIAALRHSDTSKIIPDMQKLWMVDQKISVDGQLTQGFQPLITQDQYRDAFNYIHQSLQKGRVYQVNYTQAFLAHYVGDPWALYRKIQAVNPVPFSAFLRTSEADLLSFSPERFVCIDQNRIITSPIKGTAARSANSVLDSQLRDALIKSEKNRAENVMIVDLLRNDLGKFAIPGSVKVTDLCKVVSFNAVHHLVSDIEATCATDLHPLEAFANCFPGGSITGAPKIEAMKIINEQELYARGVYCGSIGYFSHHGRIDSNIAIRTLTATKQTLYMAAGGGIVFDSQWQDEYKECFMKIKAIMKALS